MSPLYESKVAELRQWYASRLPALGEIKMRVDEYKLGTDYLPESHRHLTKEAFQHFLDGGYELSYWQDCRAFFSAAKDLGLLKVA